jgi:hypothetical protein
MTTQRTRGLILAAGVAGLLALSAGTSNATTNAQRAVPDTTAYQYQGPEPSEAICQSIAAAEETEPNVLEAWCSHYVYAPITGVYDPGWYVGEAIRVVISP